MGVLNAGAMSYRVILAKILPRRFEADFLDGNLYLNTNAYFGSIDHTDSVRFDPHDGVDASRQVSKVEIQDGTGEWIPLPVVGPVTMRSANAAGLNILCMYTISDRPGDSFDPRNLAFGERAVVIDDLAEFIRRIKNAASQAKKQVAYRPIEYVERATYDGAMGPFRKYTEHFYQNEFRFVFSNGPGEVCRLPIGDIRDIAHSISTEDIPVLWKEMLLVD